MISVITPTTAQIFHHESHSRNTPPEAASIAVAAMTATWNSGLSVMSETSTRDSASVSVVAGCRACSMHFFLRNAGIMTSPRQGQELPARLDSDPETAVQPSAGRQEPAGPGHTFTVHAQHQPERRSIADPRAGAHYRRRKSGAVGCRLSRAVQRHQHAPVQRQERDAPRAGFEKVRNPGRPLRLSSGEKRDGRTAAPAEARDVGGVGDRRATLAKEWRVGRL